MIPSRLSRPLPLTLHTHSSMNTHTIHGPVVNPFSSTERRSAGGSSGGSAAAVASGMCDVYVRPFA